MLEFLLLLLYWVCIVTIAAVLAIALIVASLARSEAWAIALLTVVFRAIAYDYIWVVQFQTILPEIFATSNCFGETLGSFMVWTADAGANVWVAADAREVALTICLKAIVPWTSALDFLCFILQPLLNFIAHFCFSFLLFTFFDIVLIDILRLLLLFSRFYLYDLVGLLLLLWLALIVLADASFMSGELAELASRFADRLFRCGSGEQSGWHV